jgi:hypothetical protein
VIHISKRRHSTCDKAIVVERAAHYLRDVIHINKRRHSTCDKAIVVERAAHYLRDVWMHAVLMRQHETRQSSPLRPAASSSSSSSSHATRRSGVARGKTFH